jgi:cytochrome c oxidase subunit 2
MRVMWNIRWAAAAMLAVLLTMMGASAAERPVEEIQITASRFAFEPATIQVTAGEPVRLVIRSADTVHGFSIPSLKIDAQVPKGGAPMTLEFTAPAAGRYEIACSEFCGSGHGHMKAALVSIAPAPASR